MLQLIVTRKCNFLCAHCMWSCDAQGEHMPFHILERALEYVAKAEAVDIIGGEPTLHPDFPVIVEQCSGLVKSMRIATNGSWAKRKESAKLEQEVMGTVVKAATKLGYNNLYVRLSDDRWHRKFVPASTIGRALKLLEGVANVYIPSKHGVLYPLGRASEGEALKFLRRRRYDRAAAECTKGEYSFWRSASIDIDGGVSPCTHHQAVCGNIMYDSMETITDRAKWFVAKSSLTLPTNTHCFSCAKAA
ncbi:MAG: hypothetical protein C0402_05420 [Thermodesulfovibrio sp.]|nr:hypothetical protein [Thermodesulfovibrio sp.]